MTNLICFILNQCKKKCLYFIDNKIFSRLFLQFRFIVSLLVLLLISQHYIYGQIKNISKNEGLTSLIVTCTFVDSKGIVWIGTNNGLNAYTGTKWYSITSIEDNTSGKTDPLGRIETIFEDSKGNIWVSVMNKIYLYKSNYWTVFAETEIDDYVAKEFFEDSNGWLWVMLEYYKDFSDVPELKFSILGGTLEMFDGVNWFKFNEEVAGTLGVNEQEIPRYFTSILQDSVGDIWLSSKNGIYKFDKIKWKHFDEKDLVSEKVLKMVFDHNGTLWAATEYGISYKNDDSWIDLTKKEGLCGTNIYQIEVDPKGRIWAYSKNNLRFAGINMIEGDNCVPYNKHLTKLKGTIEQLIWFQNKAIAYAEDGVSYFDLTETWKRFSKEDGLQENNFKGILKDDLGNIWLASNKSLYLFDNGYWKQLREPKEWEVTNLLVDKQARVWIGTDRQGLYSYQNGNWTNYSLDNGLIDNEVLDVFEDKKDHIWIITKKGISIVTSE